MKNKRLTRSVLLLFLALLLTGLVGAQNGGEPGLMKSSSEDDVHVVKVLRTTNKAQILKYVPRVYDFKKTNPHEIVNYFTSALATEEGGAYSFVAPDGISGKILVICPEYQIPYFDKLAKNLDREKITSAPGSKYIYYRLKHRSAGDLGLLNVLINYGGEVPVIAPNPLRPGQALQADFETNSLLLFDAPSGSENAQKALEEILDKPTPQVEFQVKVYEVQVNNDGTVGLDYTDWKNGPGALLLTGEVGGERLSGSFRNTGADPRHVFYSDQWSHTGGYYVDYPSAYFDFLVIKNKDKVVIENNIDVMSSSPARFASQEQYLYFSKNYPQFPGQPLEIQGPALDSVPRWNREIDMSVAPVYVGVELNVFPIIGQENVELIISMDVDNVTGYADGIVNNQIVREMPIINTRNFSDRINVPIGKEVVITGMTRERVVKHTKKIPLFGSLPIIGWFFGGESERTNKTMVVAVVKPVSVNDMRNYSDESEMIVSKAEGDSPIKTPKVKIGFDQWLLDSEK